MSLMGLVVGGQDGRWFGCFVCVCVGGGCVEDVKTEDLRVWFRRLAG